MTYKKIARRAVNCTSCTNVASALSDSFRRASRFDSDISSDLVAHLTLIRRWRPFSAFTRRASRRTMLRSRRRRKDFGTNGAPRYHYGNKNDARVIWRKRRSAADKVETRRFDSLAREDWWNFFTFRHNTVGVPPEYFSRVPLRNLMPLEKVTF